MPNHPPSGQQGWPPVTKPYPMLQVGTASGAVQLLQKGLNLAPTMQPKLDPDGQFGMKTLGRVKEFQGQKKLAPDGVVGPLTWGQLEPFLIQLTSAIDQNSPPQAEEAWRQRIVNVARSSLDVWGWGGQQPVADGSARIAAAWGYGPSNAGFRARQGGPALAMIYQMAAAGGAKCLAISNKAEAAYKQPDGTPGRRDIINQEDIGSWCGIFATYCLRAAGLKTNWTQVKTQDPNYYEKLLPNAAVRKGDIGIYLFGNTGGVVNHHFVAVEDAAPGQPLQTIDGNVGKPAQAGTTVTWWSVLGKREYTRGFLKERNTAILRPRFEKL